MHSYMGGFYRLVDSLPTSMHAPTPNSHKHTSQTDGHALVLTLLISNPHPYTPYLPLPTSPALNPFPKPKPKPKPLALSLPDKGAAGHATNSPYLSCMAASFVTQAATVGGGGGADPGGDPSCQMRRSDEAWGLIHITQIGPPDCCLSRCIRPHPLAP